MAPHSLGAMRQPSGSVSAVVLAAALAGAGGAGCVVALRTTLDSRHLSLLGVGATTAVLAVNVRVGDPASWPTIGHRTEDNIALDVREGLANAALADQGGGCCVHVDKTTGLR